MDIVPIERCEPPETRRSRGRPAIITLPVIREIGTLIAKGMTEEQACAHVGVSHPSFRSARSRNPEYASAIKEAQADYLATALDKIGDGESGWQGRAWILERRHGEQFRRNSGLELSGNVGNHNPVELALKKPFAQWTEVDLESLFTVFKLLAQWPQERYAELRSLCERVWGPQDRWDSEKLCFVIELDWRCAGIDAGDVAWMIMEKTKQAQTGPLPALAAQN